MELDDAVLAGFENHIVMEHMHIPTLLDLVILCEGARDDEKDQYTEMTGCDWVRDEIANDYFNRKGPKFVLVDNDSVPIVAGGWEPVIVGVWQAWMVGTHAGWEKHWRSITKATRKTIDIMFDGGARRLQICASSKRVKTCEWYVRGLKMEKECTMSNFGITGEDMVMFSRIKEA